ncbi:polysaccharide biosynthesis/export family protein [Alteraurantiacibacter aquimixticola]|uniref:Polysaccharide export protein n=1 Tax=Alteraurantiacibacter aquimixticola TaxID=2489173 RepID=A0A4T3F2A3_9SPHN|nr:polysaccharide biosynthesis/export family protein [Alteraurantiacibacter aquimixticola]TIX50707.1 hypothetical protein E5222_10685 [Alteraurantiacibacter aquimixticola]
MTPFRILTAALLAFVTSACALPRGGPSTGEVVEAGQYDVEVMPLAQWQAEPIEMPAAASVPVEFLSGPSTDFEELRRGDVLTVTLTESAGNGRFPVTIASPVTVPAVQIAEDGSIILPFAGRVEAVGLTTAELTERIRQKLVRQIYGPEVVVTRTGATQRSVTVMGDVARGGAVELTPQSSRLGAVIGGAGIQREPGSEYIVQVHRNGVLAEIGLDQLFSDAAYDIALQPGDIISLRRDDRYYVIMGSVGRPARVPLPRSEYMLIDALGNASGLDERTADPTGVFVFRQRDAGQRDVIYRMDMSDPANILIAGDFPLLPGDVVYVSYAPFTQTQKVLQAIGSVTRLTSDIERISR